MTLAERTCFRQLVYYHSPNYMYSPTINPNQILNIDTFSLQLFFEPSPNVMQTFTKIYPQVLNIMLTDEQSIH